MSIAGSDVTNAIRLVREYGSEFRYCVEWGKWLSWDESRWKIDPSNALPLRCAVTLSMDLERESSPGTTLEKWAEKTQRYERLNAMMKIAAASPSIAVSHEDMDSDPWLFNAKNGTVDLRTGKFIEHEENGKVYYSRRSDLITKTGGTSFEPTPIPNWLKFIDDVTKGDVELGKYLQRIFGYFLTGSVKEQVIFFFLGGGSNGKGTFLDVIGRVLGEYSQPAPRGMLESDHSDDHLTRIAALYRSRLAICAEVEKGRNLAESLVKDLTGGDKLSARRMREDLWHFHPTHKLIMQGNYKPVIVGNDEGIWRRVQAVPWSAKFDTKTENRIFNFVETLVAELPGILAWAVEGCLAWQRIGLAPPQAVVELSAQYRREMDNVREFMMERLEQREGSVISREDLREAYEAWCVAKNYHPLETKQFTSQLRANFSKFGIIDTKARVEGYHYPVRVWKHVSFQTDIQSLSLSSH